MKRLFFLVPNLEMTQEMTDELVHGGINEAHIHVVGQRSDSIQKAHLHEANLLQTSDLIPSLKRGVVIGFFGAIILSALYAYALPSDMKVSVPVIVAILFFGSVFGAWVSSLIGVSVENPTIEKFEYYLKDGHYIMMLDPADEKEEALANEVLKHHAGAKMAPMV